MPRRSPFLTVLSVVLCLWTVSQAVQGQTPPPRDANAPAQSSTGRIRGRVLAGDTGQPLGRAQVTLSAPPTQPRRTLTDADGRYEFTQVPAGRFSVSATKTGYVNLQYGQRRPFEPGLPVAVANGQTVDRIDVSLPRGAVITARVTDDLGHPIAGVQVRAMRFQYGPDGRRTLAGVYGPGPSQTDDRGELRLFGLMPGEYVVSAVASFGGPSTGAGAASEGYAPTFYPGVISPSQAAPVAVRVGEEAAVQFSLVRSRLARVSGVVVDSQGRPANGARVSLTTANPSLFAGANAGVDGSFTVADIPPGEYVLLVSYNAYEADAATLVVDGLDISDVRVVVGQGTTVSGRVVFEGGSPPAGESLPVRVAFVSVDRPSSSGVMAPPRSAVVDADRRFGLTGITGRIIIDATAPEGWMLKSVAIDGRDFTHVPIELGGRSALPDVIVTMTNKLTTVFAAVTDTGAQPVRDGVVVIVPVETYEPAVMTRRVRVVRRGRDGMFVTRGMMPGRYLAVAVAALEEGRQFSPEFQQQVRRRGQELGLREGETATVNLRLTPDL